MDNDAHILREMMKPARTALFWSRIDRSGSCHPWTMACNQNGYGVFRIGVEGLRLTCSAHRVAWMLAHGCVVPRGMEVDHTCRRPSCCNPLHLEAVTKRENVARSRGRSIATQPDVVKVGRRSIHVRARVSGDRHLVTWREYLSDGSRVQRGQQFHTREEAEAFAEAVDVSTRDPH